MVRHSTARKAPSKVTRRKVAHRKPSHKGTLAKIGAALALPFPDVELAVASLANPESGIKFVLGIAKKAGRKVSEVQSVIFDKLKWTTDAAGQWLKDHGFVAPKADQGATFIRFRQQSPRKYKEFRTVVPGVHHNPEMRGRYEHPAPKRDWREVPAIEVTNGVEFAALQVRPDGRHAISMPDQEPFRRSGNVWLDATDAEWTVVQGGRRHNPIYDQGRFPSYGGSGERDATYRVRFIRPDQAGELMDLFHLARTALSGGDASNYNRMLWASKEFSKAHPEVSPTAAYKDLDGLRSNWFGARNPAPDLAASISSYDEHLGITTRPEFQEATPDEQAAAMTAMDLCENPYDLDSRAFDAAKDFRLSGAFHETGVANARVAKYGFLKWHKNLHPNTGGKTRLLKAWMEGWVAGKRVERKGNPGVDERVITYDARGHAVEVHLTTSHSSSSYGQPVAMIRGRAYGPGDQPFGKPLYVEVPSPALHPGGTISSDPDQPAPRTKTLHQRLVGRVGHQTDDAVNTWNRQVGQGRRNPESSAASLYSDFHGRPPGEVKEIITTRHEHEWLTQLGSLVELKVATVTKLDATISFARDKDAPDLCSSEDGRQLYIEGGDQHLDLKPLKMSGDKWLKDSMVIGILYELTYQTAKGFHKFKLTDYFHKLGEETGEQPTLIYDSTNKLLSVSGGAYYVTDRGLEN